MKIGLRNFLSKTKSLKDGIDSVKTYFGSSNENGPHLLASVATNDVDGMIAVHPIGVAS